MSTTKKIVRLVACAIGCAALLAVVGGSTALGVAQPGYLRLVRSIKMEPLGLPHPAGLAYLPGPNQFVVLPAAPAPDALLLTALAEPAGTLALSAPDPLNVAFDPHGARLLSLDAAGALRAQAAKPD